MSALCQFQEKPRWSMQEKGIVDIDKQIFKAYVLSLVNLHIKVTLGQQTFSLVIETESCINALSGKSNK